MMSFSENLPFLPAMQTPVDFVAVSCSKEIDFLSIRVSFEKIQSVVPTMTFLRLLRLYI